LATQQEAWRLVKCIKKLVGKPVKGLNDLGADGEIMLKYFLYNKKDMKLYR